MKFSVFWLFSNRYDHSILVNLVPIRHSEIHVPRISIICECGAWSLDICNRSCGFCCSHSVALHWRNVTCRNRLISYSYWSNIRRFIDCFSSQRPSVRSHLIVIVVVDCCVILLVWDLLISVIHRHWVCSHYCWWADWSHGGGCGNALWWGCSQWLSEGWPGYWYRLDWGNGNCGNWDCRELLWDLPTSWFDVVCLYLRNLGRSHFLMRIK